MQTTIGRNDPCHCGSGRKYKKCHLEKDAKSAQKERYKASLNASKVSLKERQKEAVLRGELAKGNWFQRLAHKIFSFFKKR